MAPNRWPDLKGVHVVVIDDNDDSCRLLEQALNYCGALVTVFSSAEAVLEAMNEYLPTLIISDLSMPGMSGFAVAHTLRERYGSAKPLLIAITGRNAGSDRSLARSMGFDHYVAKPYDPNEVLALLAGVRSASQ